MSADANRERVGERGSAPLGAAPSRRLRACERAVRRRIHGRDAGYGDRRPRGGVRFGHHDARQRLPHRAFAGHFQGKRRDAVATGTVVVNGTTLVSGSTTNAEIDMLEDTNVAHG